jgi:hypothetical protein
MVARAVRYDRAMLKRIRIAHLYLGLLLAPSILFFSFSGAMQLFHLHEADPGDTHQPPRWISTMASVHKDQSTEVHEKKLRPAPAMPEPRNLALKIYFAFVAVGLIVSTLLGISMAFQYNRNRRLIWSLLIAGTAVPLLLLFVG